MILNFFGLECGGFPIDDMLGEIEHRPALTHWRTEKRLSAIRCRHTSEELKDFQRKVSDACRATYNARAGVHDDLVLAVAIALWFFEEHANV
jgi:hypothetical protein